MNELKELLKELETQAGVCDVKITDICLEKAFFLGTDKMFQLFKKRIESMKIFTEKDLDEAFDKGFVKGLELSKNNLYNVLKQEALI